MTSPPKLTEEERAVLNWTKENGGEAMWAGANAVAADTLTKRGMLEKRGYGNWTPGGMQREQIYRLTPAGEDALTQMNLTVSTTDQVEREPCDPDHEAPEA